MIGSDVTIGLSFIAGLLSFISPCVLPLMPAYVSYMGARVTQQVAGELASSGATITVGGIGGIGGVGGGTAALVALPARTPNRTGLLAHALMFVLGFTLVFVGFAVIVNVGIDLLGLSFYDLQNTLARVGGVIIIFFGLHVMGVTGWLLRQIRARFGHSAGNVAGALDRVQSVLFADTRRQMNPRNPYGLLGSTFMGMVFAAGWTPCVGPIYGSILFLASNGSPGSAAVFLTAYSFGLGIPFLITALALDRVRNLFKRLQRHMRAIELVSGAFLIIVGVLLATNRLAELSARLGGISDFSYNVEECGTGLFRGDVPFGDLSLCIQLGPNYKYAPPPKSGGTSFTSPPHPVVGFTSPPAPLSVITARGSRTHEIVHVS